MLKKTKQIKFVIIAIALTVLANVISSYFYERFDLTQDKRFTLSETSKNIVETIDSPLIIDVFLEGNFPPEFKRLQSETRQLLEEFASVNKNVKFDFVNPLAEGDAEQIQQELQKNGLVPAQVSVVENGKQSTEVIFPWALAYFNGQTVKIPLLKNQLGTTSEERVNNSIQNLEYAFADGFNKLVFPKKRKVAVLKGNGELDDRYIADFFKTLKDYYFIAPFTLDSAATQPQKTLQQINEFDLIVAAKPTEAFSDNEKYILDQYIMDGGASLWLIDGTQLKTDTISTNTFAFGMDINMNDFFFKYGARVNPDLVKDLYSAPIVVASGEQQETQYQQYPWFYYPLTASNNNHPIVTNTEAVKFDYASSIDTIQNLSKKTVLLTSSPISKRVGLPVEIDISTEIPKNLKLVNEGPPPGDYIQGENPLAVLLEGQFTSVFANRVKPFKYSTDLKESKPAKMIVIGDGDIIKNQLDRNKPLELGYDKWTNQYYGNKEFLLNAVNYLLDDSGLINIRTKKIAVPFLDPQKVAEQRGKWQLLNLVLPLVLLGIFGAIFIRLRKRKYVR